MIRPTFQAFETAKRSLAVAQMGLDTVGHNISNAQTPGYTRQRVDQVSLSLAGASAKFATFGVNSAGLGATVSGVNQIRDPYLDNRYRAEAAVNGELGVKYDGLTDICNIFDEIMVDGLHSKMGDLINALDVFAQQADSGDLALVVRNTANQLVQMINKNASQLEEAYNIQKSQLDATVKNDVNVIIEQIASLNVKIKEDNSYGNPSNELNDERNLLIDNLSEYLDIKVVRTPVKISDSVTVDRLSIELKNTEPPLVLIDSGDYTKLKVGEDSNGNVSLSFLDSVSEGVIPNGQDVKLFNGALKGFLDVLNGQGPNAENGVSSFRGIPYYQNSLDEFAQKLADVFNQINNVNDAEAANSGSKSGGDPLVAATTDKNLFVPLSLTLKGSNGGSVPEWMNSITSDNLQFSGKVYDMKFDYGADTVKATIDGKEYTASYDPANVSKSKLDFYDTDGKLAFSVSTTDKAPPVAGTESVAVDAEITARNLALSSSWLEDQFYMTATKFNSATSASASLKLTGSSNPTWIKSVELGEDGVKVPNGSYQFKFYAEPPATTTTEVRVVIDGTTYSAAWPLAANSRVEFKSSTDKVGLVVNTTEKDVKEGTASITYHSGAANDNILKFKDAMTSSNRYKVGGYSGSFQGFITDLQSDMSLDKETTGKNLDASFIVISAYSDQRDSISAVSVDEEGVNMMMYQNYYNAAARYMTTLDEALDKIINGMGTVGR